MELVFFWASVLRLKPSSLTVGLIIGLVSTICLVVLGLESDPREAAWATSTRRLVSSSSIET